MDTYEMILKKDQVETFNQMVKDSDRYIAISNSLVATHAAFGASSFRSSVFQAIGAGSSSTPLLDVETVRYIISRCRDSAGEFKIEKTVFFHSQHRVNEYGNLVTKALGEVSTKESFPLPFTLTEYILKLEHKVGNRYTLTPLKRRRRYTSQHRDVISRLTKLEKHILVLEETTRRLKNGLDQLRKDQQNQRIDSGNQDG